MAVLDKLCVRGIRSFGPNDEEKVKFTTPLTLFLGQNGCGKTTIIESIKYALTSELPQGTGTGSGFINDPKLSNKSTTKAHVKLRYRDCKGDFVTVAKFIEVSTQKDGKLKFKSLNPSIRWEDDKGNIEDIGGRCVDIDLYCAQKLNVSKAILNNVILCHQENAAWPLEEAKKLKERFDEIFGSTEYNKCVDKLRKMIKEKIIEIKVLREQLEQKKMAKRATERLRENLAVKEEQLQTIKGQIEQKEREILPVQTRLNEVNELVDAIGALHQTLTGLKKEHEGVIEYQSILKKNLHTEYEGSDEELNNEIINFGDFQENIRKQVSAMEEKKKNLDDVLLDNGKQLQKRQVQFGQLKQEENQHLKRIEEMNGHVDKAKVKLKVITEITEPISEILHKLKVAFKSDDSEFNQFKQDKENEERQLQIVIDGIRDRYAGAKENLTSTTKTAHDTNSKKEIAESKLKSLSHSNTQIESCGRKIKEMEETLRKKKEDFNEEREQHELEELDNQIVQKDQLQNKLDREHRILQRNYVTEQNIDREKNMVSEKKSEIESLKQKHTQHFEVLFGNNLPGENIEQSVKMIQKREDQKLKAINKSISDYEKKATALESTVKHTKDNLQSLKEELRRNISKIDSVCAGKSFSDVLKQSYVKKEKLQKDKGTYRSAKTLFEEFINQFEVEKPCCPVCETDFSGKKAVLPNIIKRLKSKIEELPSKLLQIENDLKKEEEFYNKLQQLKSINDNVQILQDAKIPLLEEELHQATEKLDETNMELVSLANEITDPQNLVETCRKVISDVALLDRLVLDVRKSEDSIESMKEDLDHVSSNRTLDQTETEISKLKGDLLNLRRQYKTRRDLYDVTKEGVFRLTGKIQSEHQKKLEFQKLVQEQPLLEKQVEEYDGSLRELEAKKKKLTAEIGKLEVELRNAERNRNDVVQKNKKVLEERRLELETCKRLIDDIQKLHQIVERYNNGESKSKLETVLKTMDELKGKQLDLENVKKILNDRILEKKEELASQGTKLRALEDNKQLRGSRKKSKELETEIRNLKQQIGNQNSGSVIEERTKLREKIDRKQDEKSVKTGELNTVQQNIKELQTELGKKEHREAIIQYKKKYYQLKMEDMAVEDLETYTQALEKSILKFHKERMVQINMTIRELWRSIYKGNDIDYIEIQTEDGIGTAGRRRTYNYKVVQVKKGVELEMRGRCSAGQRVLACLVIRMALAETFSTNCGILALDEPTTNLDRDNIMSLSDALSKIITVREKQRNFQLLIITHDEEFLHTLTREQSVSHYFRVQRNADGFSQIKKEVL